MTAQAGRGVVTRLIHFVFGCAGHIRNGEFICTYCGKKEVIYE
jgi:hypothetical protein